VRSGMAVYESNPEMDDDSGYVTGTLDHLVAGNRGRLLDARRTPVTVVAVHAARGSFSVQIDAFEDRGAEWDLGLEEVSRFQFPQDAQTASADVVTGLRDARERFDRELKIGVDSRARAATLRAIAGEERAAREMIMKGGVLRGLDPLARYSERRRGEPQLMTVLEAFLAQRDLLEIDRAFAHAFVSNPHAGELVKGHAMVLARLGLCPFRGPALRDPGLLQGEWSYAARRGHIISRLAFMRALAEAWDLDAVTLYRGTASDEPLRVGHGGSFVSATFSGQVAESHFQGGPSTVAAAMWRQRISVDRLFMTCLETAAYNDRFLEAEAVLIGDPDSPTF
jgi:hypothetical protein